MPAKASTPFTFRRTPAALAAAGFMLLAAGCATNGQSSGTPTDPQQASDNELVDDVQNLAGQLDQAIREAQQRGVLPEDFQLNAHPDWPRQPVQPQQDAEPLAQEPPGHWLPAAMLLRPQWFGLHPTMGEPEPRSDLLSDRQLFDELYQRLRNRSSTPLALAVHAAPLSLIDESPNLDPAMLEPLSERQRQQLERYHELLRITQQEMIDQDARPRPEPIEHQLRQLFLDQPLNIRNLVLARRVNGYGIFEPFEQYKFLSGQANRMIVYLELEHFRPREDTDQYEVELTQEISLYNEADGLRVWREDPVQIVDRSQNRRRDFFVVQMITLPERLSVGRYYLNVRVTDVHGQSIDEATTRIEIVADADLLNDK